MKVYDASYGGDKTMFLSVSPAEALNIIEALSKQISENSPNVGPCEIPNTDGCGGYFRFAVDFKSKENP